MIDGPRGMLLLSLLGPAPDPGGSLVRKSQRHFLQTKETCFSERVSLLCTGLELLWSAGIREAAPNRLGALQTLTAQGGLHLSVSPSYTHTPAIPDPIF